MLQYWAKVMKTIVDEYRENRDISANFKEISFGTKYRATVVGRFRRVVCDISLPLSEISFTLSDKSLLLSEISLSLNEKFLPLNKLSLPLTEKPMNMVSYVNKLLGVQCIRNANSGVKINSF